MLKSFFFIFLVLLALFTIGMLVVLYYVRKGIRFFRRLHTGEMSGEEFERMANKYYRKQEDVNSSFSDDYFKGAGWQRDQAEQQRGTSQEQNKQRRRKTTTGGVTIEDRRDPSQANKKIFAHDEGEYVDFTEN